MQSVLYSYRVALGEASCSVGEEMVNRLALLQSLLHFNDQVDTINHHL